MVHFLDNDEEGEKISVTIVICVAPFILRVGQMLCRWFSRLVVPVGTFRGNSLNMHLICS